MTIFDYLKDIFVTKRGDLPLDQYVPFLVNRWLSFINPAIAESINQFNTQTFLENKSIHYKTMISLFPKMDYIPRMEYIKKAQEDETPEDNTIKILASKYELSEKEIISLITFREHLDLLRKPV